MRSIELTGGFRDGQAAVKAAGALDLSQQAHVQALAAKIIAAGKKRRGEVDDPDDQAETDQDESGQPNGDDEDDEQPFRKRKKRSKQHPESDAILHDLSDKLREIEPEPEEQSANVVDLAAKIIAAGRKARGLRPLK